MPKQNRITPEGDIIATPARGLFMGNRGILHNAQQEIVMPYAHKAWIICQLQFKGRRRKLMQPGRYTELFFLDEATALAAGHRPCFECRRAAANAFREAWLLGNNVEPPLKTAEMDATLHAERMTEDFYKKNKKKRTFTAVLKELPNGTFILWRERPYLVWEDALFRWQPDSYDEAVSRPKLDQVTTITPPSTVAALAKGYVPKLHPSILGRLRSG
ncbi:hypothetical protein [Candidatus Leptofilum sp.]|uniref:hypothetical protein n=1 Tax=Candidatus Leptofilum sp. TaxID=3241576 RepID=UPI003B59AFCB